MKKQFATLLMLMLIPFSTLWCQDSTKVAYKDLKEILILASKGEKLDSLVYNYDIQLEIKSTQIKILQDERKLAVEIITKQGEQIKDLQDANIKLLKRETFFKRLCLGLGAVVVVETIILIK